ncbi:dihydrodipicolinate synthase family protein [Paraburkholderia sp. Ac-20336]|uniref:dihydrodipicolinate synthase family protein n=1 Tax=Paraburkholderia sp. Ac-20336 TaxID=2703886 RepID=UPI00197F754A|nr:dihydrodipicolinate synthase family protein [Paraburkholderia sp. Ac-20336]MBN3801940.1 dihydrodipicolinate synthase family protein [Paraburkholderia sp. Ac-20336]
MSHSLGQGVVAAPVLPFLESGEIDWNTLDRYIAEVGAAQPRAVAMNMALSEVSSLEVDEQLEVIRRCRATLGKSVALLSGVNATHTSAAVALAKRFEDLDVDGLVLFPPMPAFVGTPTVDMVFDYHAAVADAVKLPMLAFQNVFSKYPPGTIRALSKIPGIEGIKDASFDVEQTNENIKEAREAERRIGVLTGSDTFILEAMLMGCDGALIGFAATGTAEIVRMQKLAAERKVAEAYEIWFRLGPLARACWRTPLRDYRVRTKYALMKQGVLPNMKVRAPLTTLTDYDRRNIDAIFDEHDLFDPRFRPGGAQFVR